MPIASLRAVVVDDEQLAREELCFLLEQLGGVEIVGQAGNGIEALRVIEEEQPDLVMLDVQMPGLTGFEVARRGSRPASSRSWCSSPPSINTRSTPSK